MKLKAKTRTRTSGKTYQPGESFEVDDVAGDAMLKAGIALPADSEPESGDDKPRAKAKA